MQWFDRKPESHMDFVSVWGTFKPFWKHSKADMVFVTTWNLEEVEVMRTVLAQVATVKVKQMIVGYSKSTHNLDDLTKIIRQYVAAGWRVKVLPGMHIKIWGFDNVAYVGSCNFVPSTIHNYMHEVTFASLQELARYYWTVAKLFTSTTDLKLVQSAHKPSHL